MSRVIVTESHLTDIANAIRTRTGGQTTYAPGQMAAAVAALPNAYAAADEGKVVVSGALAAQTSQTVTENGTYDTTAKSSVTVNVSGAATILSGAAAPTAAQGANGQLYLQYDAMPQVPAAYTLLNYLETTGSERVDTGLHFTPDTVFYADFTLIRNADTSGYGVIFGTGTSSPYYYLCPRHSGGGNGVCAAVGRGENISWQTITLGERYQWHMNGSSVSWKQNDVTVYTMNFSACTAQSSGEMSLFNHSNTTQAVSAVVGKMYRCTIHEGNTPKRDFVPVMRNSDSVLGLYDLVNDVFYTNAGGGAFVSGGVADNEPVTAAYCKVSGAWQNLIGSNINDVGGVSS